MEGESCPY